MLRSGLPAREIQRRWWSWNTAGSSGMERVMNSFARGWTARMRGRVHWPSLQRRPSLLLRRPSRRGRDEVCDLFADCFSAYVGPCRAAYDWRCLWRSASGGPAGGDGDEGEPVFGDGSDADDVGLPHGTGARGQRISYAGGGCVLAARVVGEE